MGKGINLETYRFVGDSSTNKVKFSENGKTVGTYTQTEVVEALSQNRKHINGGIKLNTGESSSKSAYLIYFGGSKNEPKQIIKIIFDKKNIELGDPNALAIENLCEYSIKVKNNRIKNAILSGVASITIVGGLVGGMIWAGSKEQEYQKQETEQYQQWLQEENKENDTYKSWLEEQNIDFEQTNGRSY